MSRKKQAPRVVHIWMPDRRSLCDRRPRTPYPAHDQMDEQQFEAVVAEQDTAPVCGACIVVAGFLRTKAAVLIAQMRSGERTVYPASAAEAYESLADTRWSLEFDTSSAPDQLNNAEYYDTSIVEFYSADWMVRVGEEESADHAKSMKRLREGRQRYLESRDETPDSD